MGTRVIGIASGKGGVGIDINTETSKQEIPQAVTVAKPGTKKTELKQG